jgi:SAM-dependent methyltransferase
MALSTLSHIPPGTREHCPSQLLGAALSAASAGDHRVRWRDGSVTTLPIARWREEPSKAELDLLAGATPPVLDVGCGPARLVAALARQGVAATGIDVLPEAALSARRLGVRVVQQSVFGPVPAAGRWQTALLLDGNVGIGGDPVVLLRRVRELLRPGGRALVEVEPRPIGVIRNAEARLETPHGRSERFLWGRVGVDGIDQIADASGLAVVELRAVDGRWFVWMAK